MLHLGLVVFCAPIGARGSGALAHFERLAGRTMPLHTNPITFIGSVIAETEGTAAADAFARSELAARRDGVLGELLRLSSEVGTATEAGSASAAAAAAAAAAADSAGVAAGTVAASADPLAASDSAVAVRVGAGAGAGTGAGAGAGVGSGCVLQG